MSKPNRQLPLSGRDKKRGSSSRPRSTSVISAVGLFSGIGGVELGLIRAGLESHLLCEIEPAARTVLDGQFKNVPKHDDVCTLKSLPRGTQLVTAGFPCQDLSQAGKTRGIKGARSGL